MKKQLTLLFLFLATLGFAQNSGITYQAVIYGPNGQQLPGVNNPQYILANKSICLRFSIIDHQNLTEYQETLITTTDKFGMVNLLIGTGSQVSGYALGFTDVNWSINTKSLQVELDPTQNCTNYTEVSNNAFTYVPFAYYSVSSGESGSQGPIGPQGIQGEQGPIGLTGAEGPQGQAGVNGVDGINGTQGIQGPIGPTGPQGLQGIPGVAGTNGADGVNGTNGANGLDGQNGLSAYQIWLGLGNTGTETEFLNTLTGPQGAQGIPGVAGTNGADGVNGANGLDGQNGLSAYQTWLGLGNTGTEQDFLVTLTGPRGLPGVDGTNGTNGINGIDGTNGTDGQDGTDGQNGLSAYQTWLGLGNTGTETEFLNTLTGPAGADGILQQGNNAGDLLYWNGSNWTLIENGQTGKSLNFCYGVPQWGPCEAQVITSTISEITGLTATSGGEVSNDGGNEVTARGICWAITSNPNLTDSYTTDAFGEGIYTSYLTNLIPQTTYYVRSYATNSAGTTYGNELNFVSGPNVPTVNSGTITNITYNSATVSGEIIADGGATITEKGICYGITPNPTILDELVISGSGLGDFTGNLNDLTGNTTYYAKAYATNISGTSYGQELIFTTTNEVLPLTCNSCGISNSRLSSPLMIDGIIYATVNQSISMSQPACCNTCFIFCGASGFDNPIGANQISYSCSNGGSQNVSQVISFTTPGVYYVTGRAGNSSVRSCTVSIVISDN